jgi:uncharacterized protein
MIPSFQEGNYSEGVEKGIDVVAGLIKEDPTVISALESGQEPINEAAINIFIMVFIFAAYLMGISKSWWLGGILGFILGAYFGLMHSLWFLLLITTPLGLLIDFILSRTGVGRAIMHSTFRGGSGRSGGGGFSFGGGSSGGGGSSRSW